MPMPKIGEKDLKKPLCYDPARKKFIFFDEIVSGKEKIVPIGTLSADDMKKLVIERHRAGPDYTIQAISGAPMSRDDVIEAIDRDESFGKVTVEAEQAYLKVLLSEIEKNL